VQTGRKSTRIILALWNDSRVPVAGPGPNGERRDPGNDTSRRSGGCGADRRQDDSGEDQLAARMPGRTDPLRLCRYRHQRLLHEGAALRLRARRPLSLRRPTPERCGSRIERRKAPHNSDKRSSSTDQFPRLGLGHLRHGRRRGFSKSSLREAEIVGELGAIGKPFLEKAAA
jgi:hypothetical protein